MSREEPFVKSPVSVVFDTRLSFGARGTHAALMHLAWKQGRKNNADMVRLPSLDELAALVGASRSAIHGYIVELKKAGLVFTKRGRGQTYHVFDRALDKAEIEEAIVQYSDDQSPESGRSKSTSLSVGVKDLKEEGAKAPSPTRLIPDHVRIDGQDLAFNSLRDACGVNKDSPRLGLVTVALHGKTVRGVHHPGIRELFWKEIIDWVDDAPLSREGYLADATPERFVTSLAAEIESRANRYVEKMPHVVLTPTALCKWWSDLRTLRGGSRETGMTSDDMRTHRG